MTDFDADAVRARLDKITPGPWRVSYDGDVWFDDGNEEMGIIAQHLAPTDATFIARAPGDLRAALDEIERLNTRNQRLQALREQAADWRWSNQAIGIGFRVWMEDESGD